MELLMETKIKCDQKDIELKKTKEELKEMKIEEKRMKEEIEKSKKEKNQAKQFAQSIFVGGFDDCNQLGETTHHVTKCGWPIISSPLKLSFDYSSILSYSSYLYHSVLVMNDSSLKGVGHNRNGQISSTLQKTVIKNFTYFCIKDSSGHQLTAISAVFYVYGTLYMFSKSGGNGERQLVICDCEIKESEPVFLNISNHHPVALFGGRTHSAAICSEREVIFINRNLVKKSPNSQIKAVSLLEGEKTSSVACCDDSIVFLSSETLPGCYQ